MKIDIEQNQNTGCLVWLLVGHHSVHYNSSLRCELTSVRLGNSKTPQQKETVAEQLVNSLQALLFFLSCNINLLFKWDRITVYTCYNGQNLDRGVKRVPASPKTLLGQQVSQQRGDRDPAAQISLGCRPQPARTPGCSGDNEVLDFFQLQNLLCPSRYIRQKMLPRSKGLCLRRPAPCAVQVVFLTPLPNKDNLPSGGFRKSHKQARSVLI